MLDAAIKLEKLNKYYEGSKRLAPKHALKDVDLIIPRGSFFALLGPNGAGKSTLINILAGLVNKSSGKVYINNVDLDEDSKDARRQIGVVPQEIILDTFFPLQEALELYAGYFGIRPQQRQTEEILKNLGLWDKRNNLPKQLSGGMKRRFLVAKAMVHSPPVLILDEPTAGVDIELRQQLWEYVTKLNKQGVTIILTTHYLEEAQTLCDNIAFINHGRIICSDRKDNLLNSLGTKQVIVEVTELITEIPANLSKFGAIKESDNKIKMNFKSHQSQLGEVLSAIQSSKLTIKDISTIEPDLEDIFRQVVQNS